MCHNFLIQDWSRRKKAANRKLLFTFPLQELDRDSAHVKWQYNFFRDFTCRIRPINNGLYFSLTLYIFAAIYVSLVHLLSRRFFWNACRFTQISVHDIAIIGSKQNRNCIKQLPSARALEYLINPLWPSVGATTL